MKQRLSDTSHDIQPKQSHDLKARSESVPSPNDPNASEVQYHPCATGAVSKLAMENASVTASQDSGINLSFSDSEGHRCQSGSER